MRQKGFHLIEWLFIGLAVIFLVLSLCPYAVYKGAGDHFASDGNLERLTPQFVMVVRIGFAALFAISLGMLLWSMYGADSRNRFFSSLCRLPGRCLHDSKSFFRDLIHAFRPGKVEFWLFLLIFISGSVLRGMQLRAPLMHDEAYSMAIWGRSDLLFAISDYHLPNNHVFHSFLINLIYHHIGKSVDLLRMPVFFSGCLLILAVWLFGKLFYNDFIAMSAAGLTAFAPFLIFYSVNARGYEIQALLSVMTAGLAVYARRKQNIFSWFLLILLSGLNFFTLPIALYPFGGICVWLFLNVVFFDRESSVWRSRAQLFKYLIFMGLSVSVLSMLLYVPLLRYSGWDSFFGNIYIGGTEASTFGETMISRLKDNVQAFTETLPVIVGWIIGLGILLSIIFFRKTSREKISYGLSLLLWMLLLIPFQKPNLWPRTLLFLHPFLLLFASSGLYGLMKFVKVPDKAAPLLMAAVILAAGVSQFRIAAEIPGKIGPDEQAVRIVLEREGANAENIHFVTAAQDNAPIWIYADEYGLPGKIFDKRQPFNTVYAFVNPLNDSYLGPKELDDLLDRFGPGGNFIDWDSSEILMEGSSGILYRFDAMESAVFKSYGAYPEREGNSGSGDRSESK